LQALWCVATSSAPPSSAGCRSSLDSGASQQQPAFESLADPATVPMRPRSRHH
jgi:hypothetical protein